MECRQELLLLLLLLSFAADSCGMLAWQTSTSVKLGLSVPECVSSACLRRKLTGWASPACRRISLHRHHFAVSCQGDNTQPQGTARPQPPKLTGTETLLREAPPALPPLQFLAPACIGVWLLIGTAFFHFYSGWPLQQAFFVAVDTGLSVGFGSLGIPDDVSRIFMLVHVLFGACVAGVFLALYTDSVLAGRKANFVKQYAKYANRDESARTQDDTDLESFKGLLAFLSWVGVGYCYGTLIESWSPAQSLYFAVASIMTATIGLEPTPTVAVGHELNALLVALYSLVGVPIFAWNIGIVGSLFENFVSKRREIEALCQKMTKEEFDIASRIVSPDGKMDRAEFVVLELIRLDKIDAATVELVNKRFNTLDVNGDGYLTPRETYLRSYLTPDEVYLSETSSDWSSEL